MTFMNDFMNDEFVGMKDFLNIISTTPEPNQHPTQLTSNPDVAKELAILYKMLVKIPTVCCTIGLTVSAYAISRKIRVRISSHASFQYFVYFVVDSKFHTYRSLIKSSVVL